jgi:pimeloyl-ACP methyl ester carboxylesterase
MNTGPTVRDETVTLDGLRFHYRDWGDPDAPPVVLLHAYLQHARTWDTVARGLADRFQVLALDHRGFGESAWSSDYHELRFVADLAGFVDALKLETFSAVGFSMSVSIAVSYALLYPDRVQRLVLLEDFADSDEQGDAPWIAVMYEQLGRFKTLPASFASLEEAVAAFRPLAPYAAEDEVRHWMDGGLKPGPDGRWVWRLDPVIRIPGPPERLVAVQALVDARFAKVTCPTLLLAGADSWLVEPMLRMARRNPQARTVVVPEAGHWVPLDNPDGFLAAVRGFLNADE